MQVAIGSDVLELHSSDIDLSARVKRGELNVKGIVTVIDEVGEVVKSVAVEVLWTLSCSLV